MLPSSLKLRRTSDAGFSMLEFCPYRSGWLTPLSEAKKYHLRVQADKEKTILLAESYRDAEKLKGEGDAAAIKIYAEAFEQDPEFYSFVRTLQAYEKSLGKGTTIVLPSDSEFFRYLSTPTKE